MGLVHQGRSFQRLPGLQGAFAQGLRMEVDVPTVVAELVAERRLAEENGQYTVTNSGYQDLHRADFDAIYQELNPLTPQPQSLQQLIRKILDGPALPAVDHSPGTFELSGRFPNTTAQIVADALSQVVGRSHNGPRIQIVEDQVLFDDGNFDLLVHGTGQHRYDDTISPGRDNFRLQATYKGTLTGLENLLKKFVEGLAGHGTSYGIDFYEVDAEGDIVGEEHALYSE